MSLLIDREMLALVKQGELFDPSTFSPQQCKGCFYDLRLAAARSYSGMRRAFFDVSSDEPLVIRPRETVSVISQEALNLRSGNFGALMFTTISLLHSGVFKPATTVDPGFDKQLIITLVNWGNREVVLYPGASISKIAFFRLASRPDRLWTPDAWWTTFPKEYPPPILEATWDPVLEATPEMLDEVRRLHGTPFDIIISQLEAHMKQIESLKAEIAVLKARANLSD